MRKIDRHFLDRDLTIEKLLSLNLETLRDFVDTIPAHTAYYYYYKGMLHLNHTFSYDKAIQCFEVTEHLIALEIPLRVFYTTGWIEKAKFHKGLGYFLIGQPQEAMKIIEELVSQRSILSEEH